MLNYAGSCAVSWYYMKYDNLLESNKLDTTVCEVAGAWVIVSYCLLFQITLGTLTCFMYVTSALLKGIHAAGFACPGPTTCLKKCFLRIPRDFDHYSQELVFDLEQFD